MTDQPIDALEAFIEATDRNRWWTIPELTVPLAQSGLWPRTGLPDPYTVPVAATNGGYDYIVEQDEQDITGHLGRFFMSLKIDGEQPVFTYRVILTDDDEPALVFRAFGNSTLGDVKAVVAIRDWTDAFDVERQTELGALIDTGEALGATDATLISEVAPDTSPIRLMRQYPDDSDIEEFDA